jgi:tetratricopeptide (TPR) repeat protein
MARRATSVGRLVGAITKEVNAAERALQAGRLRAARRHYLRLLKCSSMLAELVRDEDSIRDLSISYNQCGDFFRLAGEPGRAEEMYRKSLAIISVLADRQPGSLKYRWDVTLTGLKLGDALSGFGDNWGLPGRPLQTSEADRLAKAEQAYASARQVLSGCIKDAPTGWLYQHDLALIDERLGYVDVRRGAWDDAVRRFTGEQALLRDLIARAGREPVQGEVQTRMRWKGREVEVMVPVSWNARHSLACTSLCLGHTARMAGQADVARRHYEDFLAAAEALFAEVSSSLRGPPDRRWIAPMAVLRNISIARENLGDLAAKSGDAGQARQQYRESLAALERIPDRLQQEMRQVRRKLVFSAG